jgi:hypothetical protein
MKRSTPLLLLIIVALCAGIIAGMSRPAWAAKQRVVWTAPTQNTDGTPLTDLAGYRVEWGSCLADKTTFGTYQAGINVGASATSAWIYPTGLNPVCVRLYAINSKNVLSVPAYASGPTPPVLSKPIH